jgi:hypothetical protein
MRKLWKPADAITRRNMHPDRFRNRFGADTAGIWLRNPKFWLLRPVSAPKWSQTGPKCVSVCAHFRDRRSLFPENPRPPPGLDSCVSGNGFRGLAPSSRTTLEGRPADSGALRRFLGVSRPLLTISGEISSALTFFRHQAGRCFCDIPIFSKRAKSVKKAIQIQNFDFARLDCACNCMNRSGELETFLLRIVNILRVELPCSGANLWCFCRKSMHRGPVDHCHFRTIADLLSVLQQR